MSTATYGIVFVGAGIVGAAGADECGRRGMRVAGADQDAVGRDATAAGVGPTELEHSELIRGRQ